MLDEDLAEMYQIETKRLNEQVKRNSERFPKDFMSQLNKSEYENLKSQFEISSFHYNAVGWAIAHQSGDTYTITLYAERLRKFDMLALTAR